MMISKYHSYPEGQGENSHNASISYMCQYLIGSTLEHDVYKKNKATMPKNYLHASTHDCMGICS